MTRLPATPRRLEALLLLALLAASLACGGLTTFADATATALARTPTAVPPGVTVLDPCTLVSTAEATALAGQPAAPPKPLPSGCIYYDTSITSTGVGLYVFPASQAQGFLGQYVPALTANFIPLKQEDIDKLNQDSAAGDMPAAVNDLVALTSGVKGYEVKKLDGVGSAALWSWHTLDQNQEAVLMAARPGALVALLLHATLATQEAQAQPAMAAIVTRILANLPSSFAVAGAP